LYRLVVNKEVTIPRIINPESMPMLKGRDLLNPNLLASFIIKRLLGPGVIDVIMI
jgi:hypothetical protein